MKKLAKKTYIVTFIIVSILLLIVGTLSVKAAETVTYDATEWQTFNRTKEEIGKEYSKAMGYNTTYRDGVSSTYYKIPASTENPYEPGELTQDTHTVMTNMVNYYRWLIGANPLTVVSQHSHSLQAGALVRNFQFDHQVKDEKKPDDMDYDLWNEGAHCGHNIIAMNYTPRGAITGWINEGYSLTYNKFDTLGHRSALIASKFKNVQFGYAGSVAIGVDDNSSGYNSRDLAYYAFPAPGYMPYNNISAYQSAWSIELNKLTYDSINNVTITVTDLATNESYDCTKENGKLTVDTYAGFLSFAQPKPKTGYNYKEGDEYKIEVTGIKEKDTGKDAKISHITRFFDVTNSAPSIVKRVSVNGYNNITMYKADTTKLEQIASFLPTTAKVTTETGKTVIIPVKGNWILNEANKCWTNTVSSEDLPEDILDPDNVLGTIKITYITDYDYVYSTLSGRTNVTEGSEYNITLHRYITRTPKFELYQVVSQNARGYNAIKHYDQESSGINDDGVNVTFPMKYKLSDSGTYYAIYYSSGDAYLAGGLEITVKEKEVSAIELVPPTKNTYKVGEQLDVENGKIKVTYDNQTTDEIELTQEMITDFSSETKGIHKVTVTYRGKTATFDILVVSNLDKVNATYGNTLEEIELPSDENGTYSWQEEKTTSVGDVGENTFNVKYTPKDSKYSEVENLTVIVVVDKATPDYDKNITLDATYGETLANVTIPTSDNGTYQFEQPLTTSVGNAGVNKEDFTLKFIPKDTKNYNTVTGIKVTLNVAKAIPSYNIPEGLEAGYGDTLEDVVLPNGFTWNNALESVGSVGKKSFLATFTPQDTENYETVTDVNIELSVDKTTPEYKEPENLKATYGDTLADVILPEADNGTYTWKLNTSTSVGDAGINTFDVIFTPNDEENYRVVTIKVTIEVEKANPEYTVPQGLKATYGNTLKDIELPSDENGTYTFNDELSTKVGNAGNNKFKVTYTPKDTKNYNTVTDIEVTIEVAKANPTYKIPDNLVVEYGKKLSDIELPKGFSWKDENQSVGNIGNHTFSGYFTPEDKNNYNIMEVEIPIKVVKGTPKYEEPKGLTATYGDTLENVTLPVVDGGRFEFEESLDTSVGNAGENTFYVKFVPDDQNNYNIVEHIPVTITVNKAKAPQIQIPTIADMVYNPNTHLSDIELPDGWAWADPMIVPSVQNNGYKAIYTPKDLNNYDYSDQNLTPSIKINVEKATPVYELPVLTAYKDQKLSDIELPTLQNGTFTWQDSQDTVLNEVGTHTYKVTFTPKDTVNYKTINDILATIEVGKAKPEYTIPEGLTATYQDTLSSVILPKGFTWNTPDVLVGDAGEHIFIATFTPEDTENYSVVTNIEIKVKVNKKIAEPIEIPTFEDMVYDPNRHLSDIELPDGWEWTDPLVVPSATNNGYEAKYTPKDTKNYDYSKQNLTPKLKLNISKINPKYVVPQDLTIGWGSNLSDIKLPQGFRWQDTGLVGELGTNIHKLIYVPEDLDNYNIVTDIEVPVYVIKSTLQVTPPTDMEVLGKNHTLADVTLPEGWKWVNPETKLETSGKYQAVYMPEDTEHYLSTESFVTINVITEEQQEEVVNEEIKEKEKEKSKTKSQTPATSDDIATYIVLLSISLITTIGLIFQKNRKKHLK